MCEPTTALLIASAGSSFLQFQQAKAQQKAQFIAQKRQNDIANFQQETMNKMPYGIYIG